MEHVGPCRNSHHPGWKHLPTYRLLRVSSLRLRGRVRWSRSLRQGLHVDVLRWQVLHWHCLHLWQLLASWHGLRQVTKEYKGEFSSGLHQCGPCLMQGHEAWASHTGDSPHFHQDALHGLHAEAGLQPLVTNRWLRSHGMRPKTWSPAPAGSNG